MKYKSKKGTVINIPDGLSAKDIAKIKADADAGYGTRAQATANSLGKKSGTTKTTTSTDGTTQDPVTIDKVVDPGTGVVDPLAAEKVLSDKEKQDKIDNFNLNNPKTITDQWGNKFTLTRDPVTGEITQTAEAGGTATKFKSLAEAAASTFNGDVSRKKAEEATYGTLTKNFDQQQKRQLEDQKQELANRGISYDPAATYDPNSQDLYGRTIGGINRSFDDQRTEASRQAILAGNQAYATDASARDSFINSATSAATQFGGNLNPLVGQNTDSSGEAKDILALTAQQYATKYGLSLQEAQSKRDDATRRAAIAKSGGGGGGSSGGGSSASGGGFQLPG